MVTLNETELIVAGAAAALLILLFMVRTTRDARSLRRVQYLLDTVRGENAGLKAQVDALGSLEPKLDEARQSLTDALRREASLVARLDEREARLTEMRTQLESEFRAMSQKVINDAGAQFLREASQTFEKHHTNARADAEGYSRSVGDLLKPMKDTLQRYETGLREMRDQQKRAQGELAGQIATLAQSANAVQSEARTLAAALRAGPKARGRWGETTLRNVVELTGMSNYVDFDEQRSIAATDDGGRKQPDMVVTLPGERVVAVDSKVSLADWLDAAAAEDPEERNKAMERHGRSVWTHVQQLSAKDYGSALKKDGALDFVVMFIPGEAFFGAALEARPSLIEDAFQRGVLIATPTTLIAILKSIAHSWRQQNANDNARKIAGLAEDLYEALRNTGVHLAGLGKTIGKSVADYNKLVGNMERRVLPRARRFAEYEMPGTEKEIEEVAMQDDQVRLPLEGRDLLQIDDGSANGELPTGVETQTPDGAAPGAPAVSVNVAAG